MKHPPKLAIDIPAGAVIWSGRTSSGKDEVHITWSPGRKVSEASRAEARAYPYLKALGVPFREDPHFPLTHVTPHINETAPLHPKVKAFYHMLDNPTNATAYTHMKSLEELDHDLIT